jgi:hypothetical protein
MKENAKSGSGPVLIKLLFAFLLSSFFTTANGQSVSWTVSDESGKKLSSVSVIVKALQPAPLRILPVRRLRYPNSELSVNTTNVNAAIAGQGPDKLDTRFWWDNQ